MGDEQPEANRGAWKWWCCAPAVGIVVIAVAGGLIAGLRDTSADEAAAACEQLALLRGETSELEDVSVEHVRADAYKVTATVITPGLPNEEFVGYATRDSDGDYICKIG